MADTGKGYWGWDPTTPANNGTNDTVGGINIGENATAPSAVNNAMRGEMLRFAQYLQEQGYPTAGGTANALTLTPGNVINAYANGMYYGFKGASANTTAATLAVSGLTAKAIRKIVGGTDVALAANDIQANGRYTAVYDTAANAAAGAWILTSPTTNLTDLGAVAKAGDTMTGQLINTGSSVGYTPFQGVSTEAAAAAGPLLDLYRNSASPASLDGIGGITFTGQNSTPAKVTYSSISANIADATAASEDAYMIFSAQLAGALTNYLYIGLSAAGGLIPNAIGLPRGQLSFPATQVPSSDANTLDDYEEGTWTPVITSAAGTITSYTSSGLYAKVGRLVVASFTFTITANGTGATGINIAGLPFTSTGASGASCRESAVGGKLSGMQLASGATSMFMSQYDNTYPGATNAVFSSAIAYNA